MSIYPDADLGVPTVSVTTLPTTGTPGVTYRLPYPGSSLQWDASQSKYVGTLGGGFADLAEIKAVPVGIRSLLAIGTPAWVVSGNQYQLYNNGWSLIPPSISAPRNVVWGCGDSLTQGANITGSASAAGAGIGTTSTLQPSLIHNGGSWMTWALLASEARWTIGGFGATGGWSAAQILATHVPAIISAATPGDVVVVWAGTNGYDVETVKEIHRRFRSAGLRTVGSLVFPREGYDLSVPLNFNAALRAWLESEGIPYVDPHALVVDRTTGLWKSTYYGDGTHPNQLGQQLVGQAFASVLNKVFDRGYTGRLIQHNAVVANSLQSKPLALGTPVNNTDFLKLSSSGTGSMAGGAFAESIGGQGYLMTVGDTSLDMSLPGASYTLVPGHMYRVGLAIKASVGAGGTWGFRLESTDSTVQPWGFCNPPSTAATIAQSAGRTYSDFVLSESVTKTQYRLRAKATGNGTVLSLSEITLFDLTAMGLQ